MDGQPGGEESSGKDKQRGDVNALHEDEGRGLPTLNLLDRGWLLRGGVVNRLVARKMWGS